MSAATKLARSVPRRAYATARTGSPTAPPFPSKDRVLKQGARRDPELYILGTIMAGAFGMAGYYFGKKPTAASSESSIHMAPGSMPWQTGDDDKGEGAHAKYQYHPRGDVSVRKNAPSALNTVIVPNVNLPREFHEKFNKWGKEGYD